MSSLARAVSCSRRAPDADAILRRADKAVLGETATYTLRMTVVRPGKPERVVEMKGWKKGDDLGLVRYTAPPKERGTAYLRSGESTWLFLPSAEKVVRVAPSRTSAAATSPTATSSASRSSRTTTPTLAGEETVDGQPCYKLELKAKDRSIAYDRVVYWVRSDGTFFPVRADYYTLSGKHLKWLVGLARSGRSAAATRPTLLTMESALEEGARTLFAFLAIQDDAEARRPALHAERPGARRVRRVRRAPRCALSCAATAGPRRRPARSSWASRTSTTAPPRPPLNRDNVLGLDDHEDLLRGAVALEGDATARCGSSSAASSSSDFGATATTRPGRPRQAYAPVRLGRPACRSALGKQRIAWGSGFAWNPTNRLEPPKNPLNTGLEQEGALAARLDWIPAALGRRHPRRGAERRERGRPAASRRERRAGARRRSARPLPRQGHGPRPRGLGRQEPARRSWASTSAATWAASHGPRRGRHLPRRGDARRRATTRRSSAWPRASCGRADDDRPSPSSTSTTGRATATPRRPRTCAALDARVRAPPRTRALPPAARAGGPATST